MRLTKKIIDGLQYQGDGNSRDVRWDTVLPGFGVRIYPTGQKSFVLSYRIQGRKRLLVIGRYGRLTLDQARDRARRHLASIIDGLDPLAVRKAESQGATMADLCAAYLERHGTRKRSVKDDRRRIERYIKPRWNKTKVQSITRAEIANLHHKIGQRAPYEANRVLALIRKMLNSAREWGFVAETYVNPASGISFHPEKSRDRWVTPQELPRLAKAIDEEPNIYARAALWLYLLTGVRKNELLRARWDDIDWDRKELRLRETKSGRVHYVPLSEPAVTILRGLPREENNPYILPGARKGQHLVNISKPWLRIRKAAGVEDVRLHDLRRTVGSWLAQAGNDLHLIGKVLNHSSPTTTAVYARFSQDVVHQALEEHGQRLMIAAGKQGRKQ
ncbi:MAG: site-specific integrase [Kiloniellales bacterium]|nr:site-specific integrase [Kiloniellales bacterium]